jgi:hypothetical protein
MRRNAKKISVFVSAAVALTLSATAFAGEITGNDKSLKNPDGTLNGRSICAFSGQNDTYSGDPTVPDSDGFFRTQSWGQVAKAVKDFLTSIGMNPGKSCNPNTGSEPS